MPARRELTVEDIREQTRLRVRRHRERRNATAQAGNVTPRIDGEAGNVTPPPPARHSVPPETPSPPKGGPPSVRAVPKPNKSGEVIDLLKAAGLPHQLEKADHQAVKASPLSPAQIVEAFGAVYHGEWGGEWLRQNLNVQAVIKRYAGYLSWKERPAPPSNGHAGGGVVYQPNSLRHNRRPDEPRLLKDELVPYDRNDYREFQTERRRLTLPERVAQYKGVGK